MSERKERCDGCRFWQLLPKAHQDVVDPDDDDSLSGSCHRFPPTLNVPTIIRDKSERDPDNATWFVHVATFADDWCGEFQPKRSEKHGAT